MIEEIASLLVGRDRQVFSANQAFGQFQQPHVLLWVKHIYERDFMIIDCNVIAI